MKILVVEDENALREVIVRSLEKERYVVESASSFREASLKINDYDYDCIVLDIMLPGIDGFELMEYIRSVGMPVIFLTAKSSVNDRVKGLRMGAEDYIVKPFEMLEVMVRLEKVLERHGNLQEQIQINNITIDTISHTVTRNGEEIYLKPMEYNCLMMFVRNPNKALTREQLLAGLWGVEFEGETRTVDAHVGRIRKKLGWQNRIKTIPRIGYRLEVEF